MAYMTQNGPQVEDIVDTGSTLKALKSSLQQQGAASVKIVTLLNKQARRKVDVQADYVGFQVKLISVVLQVLLQVHSTLHQSSCCKCVQPCYIVSNRSCACCITSHTMHNI